MGTTFSDFSKGKKKLAVLLSGVSALGLMLAASPTARAGVTKNGGTTATITNTGTTDFIWITGGALVTGNVTNQGTIGLAAGAPTGGAAILVDNGGQVSGQIVNTASGVISGTFAGIVVDTTTKPGGVGGILNQGLINVAPGPSSAFGMLVTGAAVSTNITNSGTLNVTYATTGVGGVTANAGGVVANSTGTLNAAVNNNNNGLIDVDASAVQVSIGIATANAVGVSLTNTAGLGASVANGAVFNSGVIDVQAFANDAAGFAGVGLANATGARIAVSGTASGVAVASFTNAGGIVTVNATGGGVGVSSQNATANAVGVSLSASGGLINTVNVSNTGLIDVNAFAGASAGGGATGRANATGTRQFASGPGATLNSLTSFNSGNIDVDASATARGPSPLAVASALGAPQTAVGGTAISISLTNAGAISASASASASGTVATANAFASGAGQVGTATASTTSNSLSIVNTSNGSINVTADANAIGGSAFAAGSTFTLAGITLNPGATALGASQKATGGGSISASLTNAGAIDVNALADANGATVASASALAGGAVQAGFGTANTTSINLNITNSSGGSIGVFASAEASTTTGTGLVTASANAIGVVQTAFAPGVPAANAAVGLSNAGSIDVTASASASGVSPASLARGFGVFQGARGGSAATSNSASLTNTASGSISINANASATGSVSAVASAIGAAVFQSASGGGNASANLTNAGSILLDVNATVTASTANVTANALGTTAADLFDQRAIGATGASAVFSNATGGSITVDFDASATGTAANAVASAPLDVFGQTASATGSGAASASFANSGSILVDFDAFASAAGFADATAEIEDDFVDQLARGVSASVSFTNANTSSVSVLLNATASGNTASASARIDGTAFEQDASATVGAGGAASASFTNTGSILLDFNALANGVAGATATAEIDDDLVNQRAFGTGASVSFSNATGGAVSALIDATANATGSTGDVSATARISGTAFEQDAFATFGAGGAASASFTNSGSILFDIGALAVGVTSADAEAEIDDDIVNQFAMGTSASVSFSNPATISALIDATASGNDASATARISGTGFEQDANANFGPGGAASAGFTNTGSILIDIGALANGVTNADASAEVDDALVDQRAVGTSASVSFTNAGSFNVLIAAEANATGSGGNASATAQISDPGFEQFANATTLATDGPASVSFTNTGSILIDIDALANGATNADASAEFEEGLVDQLARGTSASVSFSNTSGASIMVALNATANAASDASATAEFDTAFEMQAVGTAGPASASFNNSGSITFSGSASAVGGTNADASAGFTSEAFDLDATGTSSASVSFANSGNLSLSLKARASATGTNTGFAASASVTYDTVFELSADASAGPGTASLANSGTFSVLAVASATAMADTAFATARFKKEVLEQFAEGTATATAAFVNSGAFSVGATANASGATSATAIARQADNVFDQNATATGGTGAQVNVSFTNSGTFSYGLNAGAVATGMASAKAKLSGNLVEQSGTGEAINLTFNNSGTFNVGLNATATGGAASALAVLTGAIVSQFATTNDFAGTAPSGILSINNSGTLTGSVNAAAVATGMARATAVLNAGFAQFVSGASVNQASVANSGNVNLSAKALATGSTAIAIAVDPGAVQGIFTKDTNTKITIDSVSAQAAGDNVLSFTNSGSFSVDANATANATGPVGVAKASGTGVLQTMAGGTSATATMAFNNSGSFNVGARASAGGAAVTSVAKAAAFGYSAKAGAPDQIMTLDVANSGTFNVNATALVGGAAATVAAASAKAVGMIFRAASIQGSALNAGTMSVSATASGGTANSASAFGVVILADVFTGTFTNTGTLSVFAQGSTTATGIYVSTSGGPNTLAPVGGEVGTIVNDGGMLWAGISNGTTTSFGNVINVEAAPNPILISLQGNAQQGTIWGNIELGTDDSIEVTNGNTFFTGIVNPDSVLEGSLAVKSGGALTLADDTTQGPSVVNVDTYTQTSDGTIVYEVHADTTTTGEINANVATLDGTVMALINPGLYPDMRTYEEVVAASTLNGTWANETVSTNSPLLSLQAIYPGDDTADLALIRNPFNGPALTINQNSVASDIESTYSTALTGAYGTLISDLFTLSTSELLDAYDQLAGAEYAQNLQMNLWSMSLLNDAVQDRVNAGAVGSTNRYGNTLIRRGDTTVWASFTQTWGDNDGDVEAPGYDRDQTAAHAGIDYAFSNNFLAGFVAGYYDNEVSFDSGARKQEDGVQLGLYAAYDNQRFYIRGLFGYAKYDVDSRRMIDIVSTVGTAMANYDVRVLSFGGETGYRIEVGTNAYFTPFGALRYANARNDQFTETGVPGANLTLFESTGKSLLSELGIRFSAALNPGANTLIVPEFSASWQHELLDEIVTTNHAFAAVPGSGFPIISSHTDPDALLIRAGLSIANSDVFEVKAGYTGRFHGDFTEHAATVRFIFKFSR